MAAPKNKTKSSERNGERRNGKAWKKKGRGESVNYIGHSLAGKSKPRGGAAGYSKKRLIAILTEKKVINELSEPAAIEAALEGLRISLRQNLAEKKARRKEARRGVSAERARIIADAKRRNAVRREA